MRVVSISLACALLTVATTAAAAGVTAAPATLRFSSLNTGVEVDHGVMLTNMSATAVTLNSASIVMGAGPYAVKTAPSFPATLQPNATVTLTISFIAAMFGQTDGELDVATTSADTPTVKVPLFGGAGQPALSLSPAQVVFSPTTVGTTSMPQVITVTNSGFSDLKVNNPTLEVDDDAGAPMGEFAIDTTGLMKTIPFAQNSAFKVVFMAMTVGQKYATVEMTSSNNGGTQDVALSGISTMLGPDMSASVPMDMAVRGPGGGNQTSGQKTGCSCQLAGGPTPLPAPLTLVALAFLLRLRGRGLAARRGR